MVTLCKECGVESVGNVCAGNEVWWGAQELKYLCNVMHVCSWWAVDQCVGWNEYSWYSACTCYGIRMYLTIFCQGFPSCCELLPSSFFLLVCSELLSSPLFLLVCSELLSSPSFILMCVLSFFHLPPSYWCVLGASFLSLLHADVCWELLSSPSFMLMCVGSFFPLPPSCWCVLWASVLSLLPTCVCCELLSSPTFVLVCVVSVFSLSPSKEVLSTSALTSPQPSVLLGQTLYLPWTWEWWPETTCFPPHPSDIPALRK